MTRHSQQDQTERRAKRADRNEPVGSESRLHRGQREGADTDRSQVEGSWSTGVVTFLPKARSSSNCRNSCQCSSKWTSGDVD
jgi:hypothetical protein